MLFHDFQPGQDIIVKGNLGIAFMCGFNVDIDVMLVTASGIIPYMLNAV